ncbi:MAG: hypothetical protein IJQ50_00100 [Clostridia bacterium]|nr:hypothetical protein [Clostridia bacterium]
MGTSVYKGGTVKYHSIGQNILVTSNSYKYSNGYFGDNSPSTGNVTRNISSINNIVTAKDFYNKIALGGTEKIYDNGNRRITQMSDGSIITWRKKSNSDGTSVVEINISNSKSTGGVKKQKIHFIEEEQ